MANNIIKKFEECFFFLKRMEEHERSGKEFQFYVSAFLSASRSVTFVMQKEGRNIAEDDFNNWYVEKKNEFPSYCKEFIDYRNAAEKEGVIPPISGKLIKVADGKEKLLHFIIPPYVSPSKDTEKVDFVSLSKLHAYELLKIVLAFYKRFSVRRHRGLEETKEESKKLSTYLKGKGFSSELFDNLINDQILTDISSRIDNTEIEKLAALKSQIEKEVADIKRCYKI